MLCTLGTWVFRGTTRPGASLTPQYISFRQGSIATIWAYVQNPYAWDGLRKSEELLPAFRIIPANKDRILAGASQSLFAGNACVNHTSYVHTPPRPWLRYYYVVHT